jgi:hypothetical protein
VPRNRGPVPAGCGGHSRLVLLGIAASVLAARRDSVGQIACSFACNLATIPNEEWRTIVATVKSTAKET